MKLYPITTEKTINLISKQNTLVFVVDNDATKNEIKKAIEEEYKVKIKYVNVHHTFNGEKRAYVRLTKEFSALDLASKLKIL